MSRLSPLIIASLITLAAVATAPAQVYTRQPLPEIVLDEVPLDDALKYVSRLTRLPIVADWNVLEQAGVTRESPTNLRLKGVSTRTFLRYLLRSVPKDEPLTAYVDEGIVRITTLAAADRDLVLRVYDIRDLLVVIPNFTVDDVGQGGGGFGGGAGGNGGGEETTQQERAQPFIDLIQATVRPDVWDVNGGTASIRFFQGSLVVNAPRSVHARL